MYALCPESFCAWKPTENFWIFVFQNCYTRWEAALTFCCSTLTFTASCSLLICCSLLPYCSLLLLVALMLCCSLLPCCFVAPCWSRKRWEAASAAKLSFLHHLLVSLFHFSCSPGKTFPPFRRKPWRSASIQRWRHWLAKNQPQILILARLIVDRSKPHQSKPLPQVFDAETLIGLTSILLTSDIMVVGFVCGFFCVSFDSKCFEYHHDHIGILVWMIKICSK